MTREKRNRNWLLCAGAVWFATQTIPVKAASSAFENDIAAQNPLVWYKLNEPAGSGLAINSGGIGSSLNGIAFNSPTFGAAADGGDTGVAFANGNGQQQYIQTAGNVPASLQGNPTFTVEALVYLPSNGQPSTPFYAPFLWWGGNGTGNSVYFSLSRVNFNQIFVGFYNSGLVMTGTINLDSWNLITWVRNSNGGANNSLTGSTLYINGVPAATTSDTTLSGSAGIFPTVQAGPLTIERAGDFSRYFSGTVADAAVFGQALSASVIAQQYADLTGTPQSSPSVATGGVLNAASFAKNPQGLGTAVAPGSLVSIFGNFPGATTASAPSIPYPTSLGNVTVTFNGTVAPLQLVSPTGAYPFLTAQVPFEVQGSTTAQVVVTINNQSSQPESTPIVPSAPGIFTIPATGEGAGILVYTGANGAATIAAPTNAGLGYPTAPIPRGTSGFFYATGLGVLTPPVADGAGGIDGTTHEAALKPTVTIGGISAEVDYWGPSGYPGVYQINIVVPQGAPTGDGIPLVVTTPDGSVISNAATVSVM